MNSATDPEAVNPSASAVIAEWLDAESAQREPLDAESWIRRYPAHADQLRAFFAERTLIQRVTAPLREAASAASTDTPEEGRSVTYLPAMGDAPTTLDVPGYDVLKEIGGGGMGVVYQARDRKLDRYVAVKVMRLEMDASGDAPQRFLDEARAVAQLSHPNIVTIYEVVEEGSVTALILEFVAGGTLAEHIRGRQLPSEEAVAILRAVARGVAKVHARGIVHRDLKPANVLLQPEEAPGALPFVPKVADFGLARLGRPEHARTKSNVVMGTAQYMSPEQARGESNRAGPQADVYALGVMLYQMLSGRLPFDAPFPLILAEIDHGAAPPLQELVPQLDGGLVRIVARAMARDPAERFANAGELLAALDSWPAAPTTPAAPPLARQRGSRLLQRNFLAGVMVLVLAGVALVLIPMLSRHREKKLPPSASPRELVSEREMLMSIRDYLTNTDKADRRYQRFLSVAPLIRDRRGISDEQLRLTRAAAAQLLNSLSWRPGVSVPRVIGPGDSVLVFDLREVGWEKEDSRDRNVNWQRLLQGNPYGLSHDRAGDELREVASEIENLTGSGQPWIRADWFVATAVRPPLYHDLLGLPTVLRELETKLGVDSRTDWKQSRLVRGAVQRSKISPQPRVFDRHETRDGYYWRSYDFRPGGDPFAAPLGPNFNDHPYPAAAFRHDGGEVLFSLPNGLPAFMVVDAKEQRLDTAPLEIARDPEQTGRQPALVNGLSCLSCHARGPVGFPDALAAVTLPGAAGEQLRKLTRGQPELDALLRKDEERSGRAVSQATKGFFGDEEETANAIAAVVRRHQRDLTLEQVLAELGLEDAARLRQEIREQPRLRSLQPLLSGGAVPRSLWETMEPATSLYQKTAQELGLGDPR